ncbi:cyclic nucleotide-binding domain-containing protein [Actinomadura sp. KC216]|uniref:cyclic nucleotide-binding domain-containing protein n=1 Tax=Actinomadura sp. KC216 TaxID=2530370 RepID=UPI00104AF1AE|nr:cyclic nucleotide-binding domain-containing protein [Actinomadura sp. KC216]TDB89696.1 cyclic nucleotide-binding domain-containing protein [Actinomadura sp. KC216]
MSTDRFGALRRRRAASRGGGGLLSAKVTTPATLLAVVLGYGLDGSPGAAIMGVLTFLTFPVVSVTNAFVQYMRAGALQVPPTGPPPGPAPPAPVAAPAGSPAGELVERPEAAAHGGTTFWGELTPAERHTLLSLARRHVFRKEDVLCCEGGPATEVIVILSGWTRVWVDEGADQRILAFRGAGELIGERAALMVKDRSATVTAEGDVEALRVGARDFGIFLDAHPRVRAVLERQVYRRQVERPERAEPPAPRALPDWSGGNCTILITDITGFSSPARTDADRRHVLDAMYRLLEESFTASGLRLSDFYQEDRGDGALIVVPPTTPTEAVVDPMLARLAVELRRYNRRAADAARMQLRAALHVGPVQRGPKGVSGISIITARRMVDAPAVKRRVADTGADLAFVTSDFVFDTVITSAPGFVDPGRYARVRVRLKETSLSAWLTLEGGESRLRAV